MKPLKIVFLGTPEFAVESLDAIIKAGHEVAAVVTMPDKPAGRGKKLTQSPVKEYAVSHGLRVLQPERLKNETFVETLREIGADLFVVIAFRMLPEVVWAMPPMGTFNLHASLLPRYRGAAPINRAVMNGDTVTGVTTFLLRHEIDTGDILAQEQIEIRPTDNVGAVHDALMHLGARLTVETIAQLAEGTARPIPQDSLTGGVEPTPAPKIFKEDCHIDWKADAVKIHNLVRGLSPYPGAWTTLYDADVVQGDVKIFETRPADEMTPLVPGKVLIDDGRLFVGTASAPLEILVMQAPGKRRMPTADYLRGARLAAPEMR